MRVIVSGRLKARSYETREGEKRTVFEIDVDEVGPCMKYATAKVTKTSRSGGGQGYGSSGGGGGDDPWASSSGTARAARVVAVRWRRRLGRQPGRSERWRPGRPWASGSGGSSEDPPF